MPAGSRAATNSCAGAGGLSARRLPPRRPAHSALRASSSLPARPQRPAACRPSHRTWPLPCRSWRKLNRSLRWGWGRPGFTTPWRARRRTSRRQVGALGALLAAGACRAVGWPSGALAARSYGSCLRFDSPPLPLLPAAAVGQHLDAMKAGLEAMQQHLGPDSPLLAAALRWVAGACHRCRCMPSAQAAAPNAECLCGWLPWLRAGSTAGSSCRRWTRMSWSWQRRCMCRCGGVCCCTLLGHAVASWPRRPQPASVCWRADSAAALLAPRHPQDARLHMAAGGNFEHVALTLYQCGTLQVGGGAAALATPAAAVVV